MIDFTQEQQALAALLAVVAKLRDPDGGCPWDLKQTHASLRPYLIEEAYEAVATLGDEGTPVDQADELGDVLLQIALHTQLAREVGDYTFADVCNGIREKLIRRHPHVFGDTQVADAEAVTEQWAQIKAQEKAQKNKNTALTTLLTKKDFGQPALAWAHDISKQAIGLGFKWPDLASLFDCLQSELEEVRQEAEAPKQSADALEDEIGDLLFAVTSLAVTLKVHPEVALRRATQKFIRRFQAMEAAMAPGTEDSVGDIEALRQQLEGLDFDAWETLWQQAKAKTAAVSTP